VEVVGEKEGGSRSSILSLLPPRSAFREESGERIDAVGKKRVFEGERAAKTKGSKEKAQHVSFFAVVYPPSLSRSPRPTLFSERTERTNAGNPDR
jgi:hypothetical protein